MLVSNTGKGKGTATPAVSTHEWAQGFTTGTIPDGYSLGSIEVGFHRGTTYTDRLTVTLREANTSNEPADTAIATLVTPDSVPTGLVTFTAPDDTILAASTTYFVVLSYSSTVGPPDAATALDGDEDAGGADGWEILDHVFNRRRGQTGSWSSETVVIQMKVLGEAVGDNQELVSNADTELNDDRLDYVIVQVDGDDYTQGFTTGTFDNTYILSSIQVRFSQRPGDPNALTVTLREANVSGQPGTKLATLTGPGTFPPGINLITFTAPDDTILKARTTYFVVLSYRKSFSSAPLVSATKNGAEDAGAADGWSISDVAHRRAWGTTTTWNTDNDGLSLAISVFGSLGPCLEPFYGNNYQCEGAAPTATWYENSGDPYILVEFDHDSFSRTKHSPPQNNTDNYACEDYYMTMRWWEGFPEHRVKCWGDGFDQYAGGFWNLANTCENAKMDTDHDCAVRILAGVVNGRDDDPKPSDRDLKPGDVVKIQYPMQYWSAGGGCGLDPTRNTTNSTPCSWSTPYDPVTVERDEGATAMQTVTEPEVTFLTAPETAFAEQEAEVCEPAVILPKNTLGGDWTYVTQCFEANCSANEAWDDIGYVHTSSANDEDRNVLTQHDDIDLAARQWKYIEQHPNGQWGQWTEFAPQTCDDAEEAATQQVACEPSVVLPQNSLGGYTYLTQCFAANCQPNEAWNDIGFVETSGAADTDRDALSQYDGIDLTARQWKYIEWYPGNEWGEWTWFTPRTCN